MNVPDILPVEAGAFYVMDRGYVDFGRLLRQHQSSAFFVTRAESNIRARRVYSTPVVKTTSLICDQSIKLCGVNSLRACPEPLRRVRFKEPTTGKALVFLTDNTALPTIVIAQLYKSRWLCAIWHCLILHPVFRDHKSRATRSEYR